MIAPRSVAAATLLLAACGQGDPAPRDPPSPGDVVVQVGGCEVTDAELNRFVAYARRIDPSLAPAHVRRVHLRDYWLTRAAVARLAPREHIAAARDKAERLAEAVAQAGGTLEALRRYGGPYGGKEPDEWFPPLNAFAADVQEAVFETAVGRATGAIHSVLGSFVLGIVAEERRGNAPARRVYTAFFPYLEDVMRGDVAAAIEALLDEDAWLHPRYRVELAPMFDNLKARPPRPLGRAQGSTEPQK
jgi:hypothetical protein